MYKTELTKKILTSENAEKMLSMVTPRYGDSYTMLHLYNAFGKVLDIFDVLVKEFKDQVVPQTATWSLPYWEMSVGVACDDNKSIEQRRNAVLAARWGRNAMPPEKLSGILSLIIGASVRIEEYTGRNKFTVHVISASGSINLSVGLKKLDELKPSHLVYDAILNASDNFKLNIGVDIAYSKRRSFVGLSEPVSNCEINSAVYIGGVFGYRKRQITIGERGVLFSVLENYTCGELSEYTCEQIERGDFLNGKVE